MFSLFGKGHMSQRYTQAVLPACAEHLRGEAAIQQPAGFYTSSNVIVGHECLSSRAYVSLLGGIATNGRRRDLGSSQIEVVRGAIGQIDEIIESYERPSSELAGRLRAEYIALRNSLRYLLDDLEAPASSFQLGVKLPPRKSFFEWIRHRK